MPSDFAMTTLDRLLATPAERKTRVPAMDPQLRSTLDRLVGEVRAINFRGAAGR